MNEHRKKTSFKNIVLLNFFQIFFAQQKTYINHKNKFAFLFLHIKEKHQESQNTIVFKIAMFDSEGQYKTRGSLTKSLISDLIKNYELK
jgi:hypothetical protein